MAKCSFCNNIIEDGTGMLFIKDDGKQLHFCSSKCRKNMISLKRNPIHSKWRKKKK